ncbi:hypothetical protein V8B55DRAFT_1478492 [Mucor lusitanicus]|uniref:Uncharacterized protein n=1 Tax=Mucor circinelloides f. lusitanicus TaxID=29924 RepID=A0A8H4BHM5_MUCCL|nr:hypothetical protein FB192DRAFT_1377150 [Mucor lusitanicus]
MNALITSTIRLDIREEPKVGPTTCTADFQSKIIRIYIDHGSWEEAVKLSKDTTTRQLEQFTISPAFILLLDSCVKLFGNTILLPTTVRFYLRES